MGYAGLADATAPSDQTVAQVESGQMHLALLADPTDNPLGITGVKRQSLMIAARPMQASRWQLASPDLAAMTCERMSLRLVNSVTRSLARPGVRRLLGNLERLADSARPRLNYVFSSSNCMEVREMRESGYQVSGNAAEKYEQIASAFMMPWARHLVEQAQLSGDEYVVDVACGTGFVARLAAEAVGADRVVGLDVNPMMLAVAREVTGIEVRERPADDTGLDDGSVDLVLCQQGLQYFPSPAAAAREVRRCLCEGGRALFSVWAPFAENPFIAGQIDALEEHLSHEAVAGFRSTNIDRLGGQAGVEVLLRDARFVSVDVSKHRLDIDLPPMDEFFPELISATPWGPMYAELSVSQQRTVIAKLDESVIQRGDGRGTTAAMTAVVAVCTAG